MTNLHLDIFGILCNYEPDLKQEPQEAIQNVIKDHFPKLILELLSEGDYNLLMNHWTHYYKRHLNKTGDLGYIYIKYLRPLRHYGQTQALPIEVLSVKRKYIHCKANVEIVGCPEVVDLKIVRNSYSTDLENLIAGGTTKFKRLNLVPYEGDRVKSCQSYEVAVPLEIKGPLEYFDDWSENEE